jgi:hypothetical protein
MENSEQIKVKEIQEFGEDFDCQGAVLYVKISSFRNFLGFESDDISM